MPFVTEITAKPIMGEHTTPSERKRHRDGVDDSPRKAKKPRDAVASTKREPASGPALPADKIQRDDQSGTDDDDQGSQRLVKQEENGKVRKDKKEKKEKREKKDKKEKKEKKDKKEKRDKKDKSPRKKIVAFAEEDVADAAAAATETAHDAKVVFPFFTQTISLWVPLYPVGFDRPVSAVAEQHLDGLVNHYAPLLGGYLLAYRNVNLSAKSVRADPADPPTDATPATLVSVDEYAVGYGWMTADVDLFVPSRGAWLEGDLILQNEGAIGVNCWEKFNASIEAARLPRGWTFVEQDSAGAADATDAASEGDHNTDGADALPAQMHTTGYWMDAAGKPVAGKILFRIKDFDVGLAGDNGYLAIEGTMLRADEERALVLQERARNRTANGKARRQLPEFSITQFGKEDEEEDSGQRVEVYKGSRPGTPDD